MKSKTSYRPGFILLIIISLALVSAAWGQQTVILNGLEVSAETLVVELEPQVEITALAAIQTAWPVLSGQLALKTGQRLAFSQAMLDLDDSLDLEQNDVSHAVINLKPGVDLQEAIDALEEIPGVTAVWPDHIFHLNHVPNDPGWSFQHNFRQLYVDQAWDLTRGDGATVAVIDTGYRTSGLTDPVVLLDTGYDFWGKDDDTNDFIGHGTHIANTVAQATDNGLSVTGIAHAAKIIVCKVFPDSDGGAVESTIIDAINYAVEHGADVINMSLGGGGSNPVTARTLEEALAEGVVSVCASGNDGLNFVSYPAAHDGCIAVGSVNTHATGSPGIRSGFSNFGQKLDISAPGEGIVQETYFPGFGSGGIPFWGTSSASPHVAGVIALMIAHKGRSDPEKVREALFGTAQDIAPAGWDEFTGWGEPQAFDAVIRYSEIVNDLPQALFTTDQTQSLTLALSAADSFDPDGRIVLYEWDLGDGRGAEGLEVAHLYDEAGSYQVRLRVTDDKGDQDIAEGEVEVTQDEEDSGDDDDDDSCG